DDRLVAVRILPLQIVEQATTLADDLQQTTPRVVVLLVGLEVLGEVANPLREECDLHLGRARVPFLARVLGDDLLLPILQECHFDSSHLQVRRAHPRGGADGLVAPRGGFRAARYKENTARSTLHSPPVEKTRRYRSAPSLCSATARRRPPGPVIRTRSPSAIRGAPLWRRSR